MGIICLFFLFFVVAPYLNLNKFINFRKFSTIGNNQEQQQIQWNFDTEHTMEIIFNYRTFTI